MGITASLPVDFSVCRKLHVERSRASGLSRNRSQSRTTDVSPAGYLQMAIEFNCPYCSAAIRVPDKHAGKRGKCPKCETQLIVPSLPMGTQFGASEPVPPATTVIEQPTGMAPTNSQGPSSVPSGAETGPVFGPPNADSAIIPPLPETQTDQAPVLAFPAAASGSVAKRLRKKSRRRGSQRLLMWLIPVVCLGAFLGVVALVTSLQKPVLAGTLKGSRAINLELPATEVSASLIKLSDDQKASAIEAFYNGPETFVSQQMSCRIGAEGNSMTVSFTPGEGFAWFSVNPRNHIALMDWIRDHQEQLNQSRLSWLSRSVTELAQDKLNKESGQPVQFAAIEYRNGVGVNAHVKAFGYVLEAYAGDRRSFGFHEDSNGTVYFALPEDTTSFTLRGRTIDGEKVFTGEYQVVVDTKEEAFEVDADQTDGVGIDDDMTSDAPENEPSGDDQPADSGMGMGAMNQARNDGDSVSLLI